MGVSGAEGTITYGDIPRAYSGKGLKEQVQSAGQACNGILNSAFRRKSETANVGRDKKTQEEAEKKPTAAPTELARHPQPGGQVFIEK